MSQSSAIVRPRALNRTASSTALGQWSKPTCTPRVLHSPSRTAHQDPSTSWAYAASKRLIDVLAASLILLALSPVFVLLTVLIPLSDGGSPFYSQLRVGRRGRTFRFVKFRSMHVDSDSLRDGVVRAAGQEEAIRFKLRDDPRITRIGRVLRRFSLDELPQLLSVLKGDMTLVGPRPALPEEVRSYDQRARRRLDVTPGLTCSWQVSGRSELSFEAQVDLDLEYIRRRSLAHDLALLLRTPAAVLGGRGAY